MPTNAPGSGQAAEFCSDRYSTIAEANVPLTMVLIPIHAADGVGAQLEFARRGVDEALEKIGGLGPSGAAIGADRHRVGAHAFDVHVDGANAAAACDRANTK